MTVRKLLEGKGDFVSIIRSDVRVRDVVDQLEKDDVAALVISDDKENILGIISGRDIVSGVKKYGAELGERPVRDLMSGDVVTCDIGRPFEEILKLMDTNQIHHIPITEKGRLCGIVNILDVVRYRLNEIKLEAESLKEYVVGRA